MAAAAPAPAAAPAAGIAIPAPGRIGPNLALFDALTLMEIGCQFKRDTPNMIAFLRANGMLATRMECNKPG